jgi:hypothetical protein
MEETMDFIKRIKLLYGLSEDENYGYDENIIIEAENRLEISFPQILREYYLKLGKDEKINKEFNRLLNPDGEMSFSEDGYLIFYEENQSVVYWGIKKGNLKENNPQIYGNYDPINLTDEWFIDSETLDGFLLTMAYWNGVLGGLNYTANYSKDDGIDNNIIKDIESNWKEIKGITKQQLRFFANDDYEIIVLTTDLENSVNGIYIGTNNENNYYKILEKINIKWDYRSDKDEN